MVSNRGLASSLVVARRSVTLSTGLSGDAPEVQVLASPIHHREHDLLSASCSRHQYEQESEYIPEHAGMEFVWSSAREPQRSGLDMRTLCAWPLLCLLNSKQRKDNARRRLKLKQQRIEPKDRRRRRTRRMLKHIQTVHLERRSAVEEEAAGQ